MISWITYEIYFELCYYSKPVNHLLKKYVQFNWGNNQTSSVITDKPILHYSNFSTEFILTADASKIAIGAILSPRNIGDYKPITFAS